MRTKLLLEAQINNMKYKTLLSVVVLLFLSTITKAQSCSSPYLNPLLEFSYITAFSVEGFITPTTPAADGYLVLRRESPSNTSDLWPVSGDVYINGDSLSIGKVVLIGSAVNFSDASLEEQKTYYYFVYPYNDCGDGYAYYFDVAAFPLETANVPACIDEDFDDVEFGVEDRAPGQDECYYIEEPEGWDFSVGVNYDKNTCIVEGGGHGDIDSNYATITNSNSYIISPILTNPTVLEFWAKSESPPEQQSIIKVEYTYTFNNWVPLPFYTVETGTSETQEITTEWQRYVLDFTREVDNIGDPIPKGDYQVRWTMEGNPFDFAMDDIKFYCQGSDYDCPPKAKWTLNSANELGWWETDEDGELIQGDISIIPTTDISVTLSEDYDCATYGDFEVCSLTIDSGVTLNINGSAPSYNYVAILKQLYVKGTLLVQDKNSVIMVYNDGEVINEGSIDIIKNAQPTNAYDYTYWSSPIESAEFETIFSDSDQRYIFRYVTSNFLDLYNNDTGDGLYGDPDGLDDDEPYLDFGRWLNWNPDYDWQPPSESYMIPGEGYIVIAPNGGSLIGQEVHFNGKINNGIITKDVYLSSNSQSQDILVYPFDYDDWNLIGNPYPSAIDAAAFLGYPGNVDLIGGTLFRWTHSEAVSYNTVGYGGYKNYSQGDYSYFNRTGGVIAIPNQEHDLLGKIASGQSFMVEVTATGTEGTSVGAVSFANSMRYGEKESSTRIYPANDNSLFYKPSKDNVKLTNQNGSDKIWINLTEKAGAYSQMLIGFFEKNSSQYAYATDEIDRSFDGLRLISGNYLDVYSLIDNKRFAIQGRTKLKNDNIIPLGFVSNITGHLKLSIDHTDGSFGGREILLEDKLIHKSGKYHNLSKSDYEFAIPETGEFNDRFILRFSEVEEAIEELKPDVIIYNSSWNDNIYVNSLNNKKIKRVMAFDLLGREMINDEFDNYGYVLRSSNIKNGTILIFKILLEDGSVFHKKFIKL